MRLKLFFIYFLLKRNYADVANNLILDYFKSKEVKEVIAFSCNAHADDMLLIRKFSKMFMRATILKLNDASSLSKIGRANYWKMGIFFDTRCYSFDAVAAVFVKATNLEMYSDLHYWLVLGYHLTKVLNIVDDQSFNFLTDFVIAITTDAINFELHDVYSLFKDRGGISEVTALGKWNSENGLNITLKPFKFDRRANLHGVTLKAIYFPCAYKLANDSFENYMEDYQHATRDGRSKFGFHIIRHLSEMYNFSLNSIESEVWKTGDKLGPVARALAKNEADIGGSTLTMTVSRTYVLKYAHQDYPFRTCFIFRNPQFRGIKVQEILRPLDTIIWYLMSVTLIISIAILTSALHYDGTETNPFRISDSIIIVVGAVCQQSTDMKINRVSTRIIFLCLMIFSLLMYNYYSASVVSARLDEPIFKINDSLSEMLKYKLKIASEVIVYLEYFLKSNDWETKQFYHVWEKIPESEKFMDPEIGLRLVKEGGFAYHLHPDVGYETIERTYSNREICELMEVHLARPSLTAFAVAYNSSIFELLRVGLAKLTEVGLRNRQLDRWMWRKPRCRNDILTATSITIDEFSPHLLLLVIGMIVAILAYLLEATFARYYDSLRSRVGIH